MAASIVAGFSRRGLLTGLAAAPALTVAAMPGAAQTRTAEIAAQRAQAQLKRRPG